MMTNKKSILLRSFSIQNFGPFRDQQEIPIDENVTILIGANESGKTHLLKAIKNACTISVGDEEVLSKFEPGQSSILKTTYEIRDPHVKKGLEEIFNIPASDNSFIVICEAKRRLRITGPIEPTNRVVFGNQTIDINDDQTRGKILQLLPVCEYVTSTYGQLSESFGFNIDNEGTFHHLLFKIGGFFEAGYQAEDLAFPSEKRDKALREVADTLSQKISRDWSQSDIRFGFDINNDQIRLLVGDPSKEAYDYLHQRGKGLQQFLTVWLLLRLQLEGIQKRMQQQGQERTVVLLLDEDNFNLTNCLHPPAQKDIIKFLSDFAANNNVQIILSTHSPFLVDWNHPEKVRVLLRNLKKPGEGTKVLSKPHKSLETADRLTAYEPVLISIGLYLGDFPFIGTKNLVVEGVTDHLLLRALIRKFAEIGKPILDMNHLCITPGGSADQIEYLVRYLIGRGTQTIVLVDNDKKGRSISKRLQEEGLLTQDRILCVVDALDTKLEDAKLKDATLEDLLPRELYIQAVNEYYSEKPGLPFQFTNITVQDITSGPIFKALEDLFVRKFGEGHKPDKFGITQKFCELLDNPKIDLSTESWNSISKLLDLIKRRI